MKNFKCAKCGYLVTWVSPGTKNFIHPICPICSNTLLGILVFMKKETPDLICKNCKKEVKELGEHGFCFSCEGKKNDAY